MIENMIAQLHGSVLQKNLGGVVIDVGGVGYKVFTSASTLEKIHAGETATLFTYLAVRENAMDLYGFFSEEERDFFELLITVPGIGPRSGITILSLTAVPALQNAIASEDYTYLTKVSGIGRKTAEKIVVGLKDKVGVATAPQSQGMNDVVDVLESLGYSAREVQEALRKIPKETTDTGERVKAALKSLSEK